MICSAKRHFLALADDRYDGVQIFYQRQSQAKFCCMLNVVIFTENLQMFRFDSVMYKVDNTNNAQLTNSRPPSLWYSSGSGTSKMSKKINYQNQTLQEVYMYDICCQTEWIFRSFKRKREVNESHFTLFIWIDWNYESDGTTNCMTAGSNSLLHF